MKKLLALVLSLLMVLTAASAMAKTDIPDLSGLEGITRFEEPVQISFARITDSTAFRFLMIAILKRNLMRRTVGSIHSKMC